MTIAAKDEHESKLVHTSRVTIACLWLPISLKSCNTVCCWGERLFAGGACECLLVVGLEVSDMSAPLHLLVV